MAGCVNHGYHSTAAAACDMPIYVPGLWAAGSDCALSALHQDGIPVAGRALHAVCHDCTSVNYKVGAGLVCQSDLTRLPKSHTAGSLAKPVLQNSYTVKVNSRSACTILYGKPAEEVAKQVQPPKPA